MLKLANRLLNESTTEYLKRLGVRGFLFHGSSDGTLTLIEPRKTFDPKSTSNSDTAVFATDNPGWATIFGLYGGNKGWSASVSNNELIAKIPKEDKGKVERATGYVYILERRGFPLSDSFQYKTYQAVKPVTMINVKFQDYLDFNGKVEWV